MTTLFKHITIAFLISVFFAGIAFATDDKGHDMTDHDKASQERIGVLIYESVVDGYMLAYHFIDQIGRAHV